MFQNGAKILCHLNFQLHNLLIQRIIPTKKNKRKFREKQKISMNKPTLELIYCLQNDLFSYLDEVCQIEANEILMFFNQNSIYNREKNEDK